MFKGLDKPKDEAVEATPFEGMETTNKPEIGGSSTRTRLAVLPAAEVTFNKEDLVTPRLKLMQGLSTEVQDGNARPGQWVLTGYTPGAKVVPCRSGPDQKTVGRSPSATSRTRTLSTVLRTRAWLPSNSGGRG